MSRNNFTLRYTRYNAFRNEAFTKLFRTQSVKRVNNLFLIYSLPNRVINGNKSKNRETKT